MTASSHGATFCRMTNLVRSLALAALLLPGAAFAQSRSIDWPTVSVTAHLDSAGVLHIAERQTIRLSGDWNGAERSPAMLATLIAAILEIKLG